MVIRVRWPIFGKRALVQRYFAHRPLSGPICWLYVVPSCWLNVGPICTHGKLAHCWQVHVCPTYMTLTGHTDVGSTQRHRWADIYAKHHMFLNKELHS